jgi:hypothetical protein
MTPQVNNFNDTYRDFTSAFLIDPTRLDLNESHYQNWTAYLYRLQGSRFKGSIRAGVAEALFTHQRQHPYALGLWLACVYPLAVHCVSRLLVVCAFKATEMTQELMFNGAINSAIDFFRFGTLHDSVEFSAALYFVLKSGAIAGQVRRRENHRVEYHASVDRHQPAAPPRTLERLIASQILDRIADLEIKPHNIGAFLRGVINLGPEYALLPISRSRNRARTHSIDYEEICDGLGLTYNSAWHYFSMARKILRRTFNADGSLFTKSVARAISG